MPGRLDIKHGIIIHNIEEQLNNLSLELFNKKISKLSNQQIYILITDFINNVLHVSEPCIGEKKIYYISMEFLIGRLLSNNLINLGMYEVIDKVLKDNGKDLSVIEEMESEPALGNGGLGRLAACFLDSITTLGIAGEGVGIAWHFGLFKQYFSSNLQKTKKDIWMDKGRFLEKTDTVFEVAFGRQKVKARLYNLTITGYISGTNKLRLFDLESVDEGLVSKGIDFDKTAIKKNLSLFLYPDDSDENGNLLRIYQEYFLSSCAAQLIFLNMREQGYDLRRFPEYTQIQINDTHPTLIIPELIRILMEHHAFTFEDALSTVRDTCSYTNHTILAEALEKWPLKYIKKVVPQLVPYINMLHETVSSRYNDPKVQIIDRNKVVHMANIDIHFTHSVNGVAALHTEILKNTELKEFYALYPEKFNNKTNGITFRRWLMLCNKPLCDFLEKRIGSGFKKDAEKLEKLLDFIDDKKTLNELDKIKQTNKKALADYIWEKEGIEIDSSSIFDIQAKRMHEYKRQQMNALYIIHKYLEIKRGKVPRRPVTYIFGAKAAPAYIIAQDIIHLILVLQQIINNDPAASKYMKVVMLTNYNVSYAEKLIPACDISEQISLASKEASGTGNMKFMLNGAVTLGTEDGANVEIHKLVGDDNIFIFGKDSDTVIEHYNNADYVSKDIYNKSKLVKEAVDFIISDECIAAGHRKNLTRLYNELLNKDWFMTLLDLEEYIKVKDKLISEYSRRTKWKKMMLVNIAKAGYFSSDRTIKEYNRDIWHIPEND